MNAIKLSFAALIFAVFIFASIVSNKLIGNAMENQHSPSSIKNYIDQISLGSPKKFKNMVIYPLEYNDSRLHHIVNLDEALNQKIIEITEKGEGSVNTLVLEKNKSNVPVYIMAGEIVKGAKQDRIIAHDIILGTDAKTYEIPVYCVEQGRWSKQSEKFNTSNTLGAAFLRSAIVQNKAQSTVWSKVAKNNTTFNSASDTSNYGSSYESKIYKENSSDYLDHYIDLATKDPSSVGVIVEINNKIVTMDLFGNHSNFKNLWPKLLKSYIQDALDNERYKELPSIKSSQAFLSSINNLDYKEIPNPGLGNEYIISDQDRSGNSLVYDNEVIHIALFAGNDHLEENTPQIQRPNIDNIPSIRRNRR